MTADRCMRVAREAMASAETIAPEEGLRVFDALHACWLDLVEDGRNEDALTLARASNELFPLEPQSGFDLGASLLLAERPPAEARTTLEAALDRKGRFTSTPPRERALALKNLGRVLLAQGEIAAARDRLAQALAIDSSLTDALYDLAAAEQKAGDAPACLSHIEQALAKDPERADADDILVASWAFVRADRPKEAQARLREAIGRWSNTPGLHINLGYALMADGRAVEALFEYLYEIENGTADDPYTLEAARLVRESLASRPSDQRTAQAYGQMRAALFPEGDSKQALVEIDRLEEAGYSHPTLSLLRAEAYYAANGLLPAERILRRLLESDPALLATYYDLAQILMDTGREDEARRLVAQAAKRNPTHWQLTGQSPLIESP